MAVLAELGDVPCENPTSRKQGENGSSHPIPAIAIYVVARYNKSGAYRSTIQSGHEEAQSVGLSGVGRVSLPDSKVLALQRTCSPVGGDGVGSVSTHADDQGHPGRGAAADPGTGQPDAHSASQRGGTD